MSSQEVDDAVGEAPARESAAERLEAKKAELKEAEAALAVAETAMDVPAVVRLQGVREVLRRFIPQLEVEALHEAEGEARQEARTLLRQLRKDYVTEMERVTPEAEQARLAITAAQEQVGRAFGAWSAAARVQREVELVCKRFGFDQPPLEPTLGQPPDLLSDLISVDVKDKQRPLPQLVVSYIASDDESQRAAKRMTGAATYVRQHARSLSPAIVALFSKAAIPEAPAKAPTPQRADSFGDVAQYARAVKAGLDAATNAPESPAAKADRVEKRRRAARDAAETAKRMGEEAQRLRDAPAPATGPLNSKGSGMRD